MTEPLLEHCPHCRQDRNVKEIARDSFVDTSDPNYFYSNQAHFFQCQTCRDYFLKVGHSNEHDEEYETLPSGDWIKTHPFNYHSLPPQAYRDYPSWLNRLESSKRWEIHEFLKEVYKAFDHELYKFSAMGVRALFEKISHDLGVSNTLPFVKILQELEERNLIAKESKDALEVLVEGGHAAVHRSWSPSREDLIVILDILEDFIYESFFKGEDIVKKMERRAALKKRLPPDTRRRKPRA